MQSITGGRRIAIVAKPIDVLDTGTILALKGPADGLAFPLGSSGDYVGLTRAALDAEPE
jgi:hypothetical protein